MDKRFFFLLVKAQQAVTSYLRQELTKSELKVTPGQTGVLFLLEKKSNQIMRELSSALEMDNSAVTRIVDRLEKNGLVKRTLNGNDRREFFVTITESGLNEIMRTKLIAKKLNKKLESEFSPEDLEQFRKMLTGISAVFKAG